MYEETTKALGKCLVSDSKNKDYGLFAYPILCAVSKGFAKEYHTTFGWHLENPTNKL